MRNVKKKIAFVVWTLADMGGSERVVYDIVRNLGKNRCSSIVVGFEDGPFRALYENLGIKTYCISKSKKIDADFVKQFRGILADEQVKIVNPHHFSPLVYSFLATRFTHIKLIYTEHSRWQLEQLPPVKKVANRLMLGNVEGVVAISEQIEDYYLKNLRIPKNRVHLIPNGIDVEAFRNARSDGLREKLGIGPNETVIGVVANIRPEKNLKLLVSAFSDLAKEHGNTVLVIAGQDFMNGELHSFASRSGILDQVLFLGRREDVPGLLRLFDIFCLPSKYEGMPLTVLEAMAAGVPVVGADVLGINEVVRHSENGLLFRPDDRESLIACLLCLIRDDSLRRRFSLSGKAFVEKMYSLERTIRQYEELFSAL